MPIPSIDELLKADISDVMSSDPVPEGTYDAVITDVTVRQGAKGPYLAIETTIHDEEYRGRKVWRNSSFSEKALFMPGGIAQLLQAIPKVNLDQAKGSGEQAIVIANAARTSPVTIEVEHEQVVRQGNPAYKSDGTPEMRGTVKAFYPASEEFVSSILAEAAGVDDDLPF